MKTAIAGAALTFLSISLPVVAATTTKYQFKGENAYVTFYQYDDCISKNVYVSAFTNRTKNAPGAPVEQMGADIFYYISNNCTGESASGYGYSPNAKFTIDNQLNSATLTGTFAVYEYSSGTTKTAEVDLTVTGVGLITKGRSSYSSQTPYSITRYRSTGEYREAQGAGSIILDGINLIDNTANYGTLNLSTGGSYERIAK